MRKREIYERCKAAKTVLEDFDTKLKKIDDERENHPMQVIPNTTEIFYFQEYCNVYNSVYEYVLRELGAIDYFKDIIVHMDSMLMQRNRERIYEMKNEFDILLQKVNCAISLLEAISGRSEEGLGLEITLPDLYDITELKKYVDSLEFVFTKCPFLQSDDASLKLETAENGSIIFIFGIVCSSLAVGSVFLNNIVAFIDKCFVIKSHSLTCTRQKQEIEIAKIEQKEKEELLKNIDRLYRISVENAIRDMQVTTGYHIQDGEEKGRAEQSFEKMIKLLEQGLQIHTSIDSPQEVKALFEPLEMHYLSAEKELKKIEKKSEKESDKESE